MRPRQQRRLSGLRRFRNQRPTTAIRGGAERHGEPSLKFGARPVRVQP
jgi:hypothetical protein